MRTLTLPTVAIDVLLTILHVLYILQLLTTLFFLSSIIVLATTLHELPPMSVGQSLETQTLDQDIPAHIYMLPSILTILLLLTLSTHFIITFRRSSCLAGSFNALEVRNIFWTLELSKLVIWLIGQLTMLALWLGAREREQRTGKEAWPKGHEMIFGEVAK
jgi:hypothetical protein